jgi:hypothetical protein
MNQKQLAQDAADRRSYGDAKIDPVVADGEAIAHAIYSDDAAERIAGAMARMALFHDFVQGMTYDAAHQVDLKGGTT